MKYDTDGKTIIDDEGEIVEDPSEEQIQLAEDAKKADEEGEETPEEKAAREKKEKEEGGDEPEGETVSLAKHLKLKKELKDAKANTGLSKEDREAIDSIKKNNAEKALQIAFDGEFEKLAKIYPDLADKKAQLYKLVQVEGNEEKSLEEVALDTFSGFIEKPASEDEPGGSEGETLDTSKIDFDNMSQDQYDAVMKDPVAKQKYFDYADTKT